MRARLRFVLMLALAVGSAHGCQLWNRARPAARPTPGEQGLAIGSKAPNLEGHDCDGNPIRLSDHRGKVVVVDFWATWCAPCRRMLPHECALVAKLAGQPFAFIGVSADSDREALRKLEAAQKLNWRSCFDGANGPITTAWRVNCWPTLYVLDGAGVIRYRPNNSEELDAAVLTLLKEQQGAK